MKNNNRKWNIFLAVLCTLLAVIVVIQQIILRPVISYGNDQFSITSEDKIDITKKYGDQAFFVYSYSIAQNKRTDGSWYKSDGMVTDSTSAVIIADIILKRESTTEFDSSRKIEHDIDHKLWAIKYKMKSWPFGEAVIIIDQLDGAELLFKMPQPM